ncbi:hypothetical protein ACIRJS_39810 [Streptomyces sp. NPDC102340]|uniref:hypothetical protein n=1 Tax=unclassified Streptomyces TaxID=2593676 RepID=UPI0037FE0B7D
MGEGSVPAGFESGEEPGVDAVGNVSVDIVDAFQGVAEAAGLGDVGDVVLDEPSLVGVAEVVEGQARFEWGQTVPSGRVVPRVAGAQRRREKVERRRLLPRRLVKRVWFV